MIKRFQPKDRGKAYSIMKRTSHLVVTLDEREDKKNPWKNRPREEIRTIMGQKVNPIGFRVGITEDWKSRWYAPKSAYGDFLVEDFKVRKHIDQRLNRRPPFAAVSDILIERTREEVTITLKTARPGLVIGPKGAEVDKLREELEDLIKRKVAPIKVIEIKNPDLNAQLVAEAIAEQLEEAGQFPPRAEDADGRDDAGGSEGNSDRRERPAGRGGNRPQRKGDGRFGSADDAAGGRELRICDGVHDLRRRSA